MLQKFSFGSLVMIAAALLSACSAGSDALSEPVAAPVAAAVIAPLATPAAAPSPQQEITAAQAAAQVAVHVPAVLKSEGRVSESERVAEELRMVDFEQSFSIEMNRRAQEQAEREQRAAVNARAGMVQGPGCEGTEGHAALECERSISQG